MIRSPDPSERSDRLSWYAADLALGETPRFLADGGELYVSRSSSGRALSVEWHQEAKWSPTEDLFAFTKHEDGARMLWVADVRTGGAFQIAGEARDVLAFGWLGTQKMGVVLGLPRDQRYPDYHDSLRHGALFDDRFQEAATLGRWRPAKTPERGAEVSERAFVEGLQSYDGFFAIDVKARAAEAMSIPERAEFLDLFKHPATEYLEDIEKARGTALHDMNVGRLSIESIIIGGNGSFAAWKEPVNVSHFAGANRLYAYLANTHRIIECPHEACTDGRIGAIWTSHNHPSIVFQSRRPGFYEPARLYAWNPVVNAVTLIRDQRGFIRSGCSSAGGKLICAYEDIDTPPSVVSFDMVTGAEQTLFSPNVFLNDYALPNRSRFTWRINETETSMGTLIYPFDYKPGRRYPLVLACYTSGGFPIGGEGDFLPLMALAKRGFFVLECSFNDAAQDQIFSSVTSADQYNVALMQDGAERSWRIVSIRAGVNALVDRGFVDPNKVGMAGFSKGAYTTAQALIQENWVSAAVLATPTISKKIAFLASTPNSQDFHIRLGRDSDDALDIFSLAKHASRVCAPVQIHAVEAEAMGGVNDYGGLRRAGVPAELYIYPDNYHFMENTDHRLARYERSADWLNFWLQDHEDPAPKKANQYYRWRKMRDSALTRLNTDEDDHPKYCASY